LCRYGRYHGSGWCCVLLSGVRFLQSFEYWVVRILVCGVHL
jgi:hypothetical protein